MLTNDLSDLAMDYPLRTGKNTSFMLKERMLKRLFTSFYGHQEQRNVYGYLTEISAFRGIFSVMREMIENDANFREYLKDLLKDQYFPFEQLIRFLRNVLNHTTTSSLKLKLEDYEVQRDFILSPKVQRVQKLNGSTNPLRFMKIVYQTGGTKTYTTADMDNQAAERAFRDNQYYYPIPWDEVRFQGIEQNAGWHEK